jgi:hypothetical protein
MAKLFAFEDDSVMDETVPAAAEVEAEQGVSELAEDAVGVDEGVTAIDDGEEAAAQLEEVQEVVAATVDGEGEAQGLDPVAAEAIRIAVESICARMGASTKQFYALYATENFQSKSSRVANTKIALENIADTLKGVWAKIVAFLKGLVAKVVGFWTKLRYSIEGTLKSVKALQKKVKDNEGSTTDLDKDSKEIVLPKSILGAFGEAELTPKAVVDQLASYGGIVTGFSNSMASVKNGEIKFNNDVAKGASLFFNKVITAKALTKSVDSESGDEKVNLSIEITDSPNAQPEVSKSQVLKKSDMKSILDACVQVLTAMSGMYQNVNNLNDMLRTKELEFDKAIAALNRGAAGAGKDDEIAQRTEMMKKFKKDRATFVSLIKMASPKLQVNGIRGVRASMDYVKVSLAKYK